MKNSSMWLVFRIAGPAIVAGLCGCHSIAGGTCQYALRSIEAAGQVTEGSNVLLYAKLDITEQRDFLPNKSMSWLIQGATLKGHVTSAVLRDAGNPSQVLFTFQAASPSQPELSQGYADERLGANLSGLFDVTGAGRAMVDLRTDIPGRESISVIPVIVFNNDWHHPDTCS